MAQTKIWDIEGMFQAGHKGLETIWEQGFGIDLSLPTVAARHTKELMGE